MTQAVQSMEWKRKYVWITYMNGKKIKVPKEEVNVITPNEIGIPKKYMK